VQQNMKSLQQQIHKIGIINKIPTLLWLHWWCSKF